MSNYVIIGIHGLRNKPPADNLQALWARGILDGLQRNEGRTSDEGPRFKMVYWADVTYPEGSLDPRDYPVYDGTGKFPEYEEGFWASLRAFGSDLLDTPLDAAKQLTGIDPAGEVFLRKRFEDLHRYYNEADIRDALRKRMRDALTSPENVGKRVMVIAHSMGSIVAYDTLRLIGQERRDIVVDHFVTIGSPLGLPTVKYKIWEENDRVRTPSIVRKWTNLSERRDPVAFDTHLARDFKPNDAGVAVRDDLVINDTVPGKGLPDFHSSVGYLRTPEMSRIIRDFI